MFSIGDVVESGSVSGDDESACAGSRGRLEIDQSRYRVGEADGALNAGSDVSSSRGVGETLEVVTVGLAHEGGAGPGLSIRRAVSSGRRPGVSKITSKRPVRL